MTTFQSKRIPTGQNKEEADIGIEAVEATFFFTFFSKCNVYKKK